MSQMSKDWCSKGHDSFEKSRFEEAIHFYEKCIEMDTNNPKAWINKCISLNYLGKYNDALNCSDEALKIDPNNGYALYVKGYALDYSGKHEKAIAFYDNAIKIDHNEADYYIGKGIALNYLRNYPEEEKYADKEEYKKEVERIEKKNYGEAIYCFDKAKEITNKNSSQPIAYALINKGESLYRLKKHEDSLKCYEDALTESRKACDTNPIDSHAWTFQGISLYKLGWFDKALKCFDKVIEDINPKFDLAWYHRGYVLNYSGKHEEAIKYYDEATKLNQTDADYLIGKGVSLYEVGKDDEAVKCFEKALEIDSTYDIAYLKIGEYEYRKEKYPEALRSYRKVHALDYYAIKHNNMGLCYYWQALYEEAKKEYQEAIKSNQLAESYYNLGVLYNKIKNENDAKLMFEKYSKLSRAKDAIEAIENTSQSEKLSKAKDAIEAIENTSQSEWFGWWYGHEKIRKILGLILMFSIPIVVIVVAVVIAYISLVKNDLIGSSVTGLVIMLGFLVLIMLLPSIRRFKVSEIELETLDIAVVRRPDLEPMASPKVIFRSLSPA